MALFYLLIVQVSGLVRNVKSLKPRNRGQKGNRTRRDAKNVGRRRGKQKRPRLPVELWWLRNEKEKVSKIDLFAICGN